MVYRKHWGEFKQDALALYAKAPERARLVVKARPSTQMLVLKLTDDHVTLKYRAKSAIILNRLDEFQRELFEKMSGVAPAPQKREEPAAPPAPAAPADAAPKQGGGKSKNKKKGKKK